MKYLTEKDLAERYSVASLSVRRWMVTDNFPQPVRLTPGTVRWLLEDVLLWEEQKRNKGAAE